MRQVRSPGRGSGRIIAAVSLGLIAVALLVASLLPTQARVPGDAVSLPDFFLAVGASTAVASVFFFLSNQIKRAEARTDDAIAKVQENVSSLSQELQRRAAAQDFSAQQAARAAAGGETVQSLLELSSAASDRGLGASLCVALRGRRQLSLMPMSVQGHVGPVRQAHWLGVEEVPEHVSEPSDSTPNSMEWFRRQEAVVSLTPAGDLADALDELRRQLLNQQTLWPEFPQDVERALENLSQAMQALFKVSSLNIGRIEVVLDGRYVLTHQGPTDRLLVDVLEHGRSWSLTPRLAKRAEEPTALAILRHPLVARHLDNTRNQAKQAEDLLKRKRDTRAMSFRVPPRR